MWIFGHFHVFCVFKLADAGHSGFCIFAGKLLMDKPFSKAYLAIFSFSCAVMFWYGVCFFCEAVDPLSWLHTVFSSSCTDLGFPHSCCHSVRKNLARSDTLPHLRTKKEEIHTPHPARTKHIVVKVASSIGRSCLLYQFTGITSKMSFDNNDCHYQSISVLV